MTTSTKGRSANRVAKASRETLETQLKLELSLDGTGKFSGKIGVPFFEHMLNLLVRHAQFDLSIGGKGDVEVDAHHTVEDLGILLGETFRKAVGDKKGINRYGTAYVPMEESLARAVLDLCDRPYFVFAADIPKAKIGDFDAELGEEFLRAFFTNARITAHIDLLRGGNLHHMLEACFKAVGLAMRQAVSKTLGDDHILSTKGKLA